MSKKKNSIHNIFGPKTPPKRGTIEWHQEQIFKIREKEREVAHTEFLERMKEQGRKTKCPECNGSGTYTYHWQECGNSQIDKWVSEECSNCDAQGWIKGNK